MTHETHRCSVDGCPNLAAYEVRLYDFDPEGGAVRFERDEACPYLCLEHAVDNERGAHRARACARSPFTRTRTAISGVG